MPKITCETQRPRNSSPIPFIPFCHLKQLFPQPPLKARGLPKSICICRAWDFSRGTARFVSKGERTCNMMVFACLRLTSYSAALRLQSANILAKPSCSTGGEHKPQARRKVRTDCAAEVCRNSARFSLWDGCRLPRWATCRAVGLCTPQAWCRASATHGAQITRCNAGAGPLRLRRVAGMCGSEAKESKDAPC